ncbi:MAG: ribbon-helix-helix protein, CopG family [Acidimicrobiaceae bacterium]|nr:ribbon-helix-helix protein, CopG family [Acidimicrobiaceae bacterium]MCY4279157.1 ribbon-helix-helix protein, CopG family [Acidimicrobiaceae bacterium]MCY4294190.1 ribbon-helix-helix protein, CopG family [Acidimicrobiaceae bacterium]
MATQQVAVRLPSELLASLDRLVESGVYKSRAAVVRAGIEAVAELEHRRSIDRAIVDGYTRTPPPEAESRAALASLRDAILEEPW